MSSIDRLDQLFQRNLYKNSYRTNRVCQSLRARESRLMTLGYQMTQVVQMQILLAQAITWISMTNHFSNLKENILLQLVLSDLHIKICREPRPSILDLVRMTLSLPHKG